MKRVKIGFLLGVEILAGGCSMKSDYLLFQEDTKAKAKAQTEHNVSIPETPTVVYEYKIAPRDRLSIMVFRHPELSTRSETIQPSQERGLLVSSDGTVSLPLVGSVRVEGLTREEAAGVLEERYAKYLKDPHVTVEILNQRIYVVGEVNKPGVVTVTNEFMTLVEAIAQAGDFSIYGEKSSVKILRGDWRNPQISTVDMTHLSSLGASDLILRPGDVVYVEPNSMRATNIRINEYRPGLQLINDILSPFVNIKYLTK